MVSNVAPIIVQCATIGLLLAVLFTTHSMIDETRNKISNFSETIRGLSATVERIETNLTNLTAKESPENSTARMIPTVVIMNNFQQHKNDKDKWFSPPMYTHYHGYKFCLKVFANGRGLGEGTHVTATVNFMRGEYDDHLKWPFRGIIAFQLLDHFSRSHKTVNVPYTDDADNDVSGRVTDGDVAEYGLGAPYLIAQNELKPNYLQGDALHLQVHRIGIVYS